MIRFAESVRQTFPGSVERFDSVEAESAAWGRRFEAAKAAVTSGFERAEVHRQNNAELLVAIPLAGLATRVEQLAAGVVSLVNDDNPHAAPPVARALFEACCVPIYLERELLPRLRKGRTKAVHRLIFKFGLGGTGALGGHIKPLPVDAVLKSAREELKAIEAGLPEGERINAHELIDMYYGPLSDLTHPNWAALTMGTDTAMPPRFTNPVRFSEPVMHDVAASGAYVMDRGGRAFDEVLRVLASIPMDFPTGEPEWPEGGVRPKG